MKFADGSIYDVRSTMFFNLPFTFNLPVYVRVKMYTSSLMSQKKIHFSLIIDFEKRVKFVNNQSNMNRLEMN